MARILLECGDVVGPRMAGPAIRYWEMAKALSRHHDVTLRTPDPPMRFADEFSVVQKPPSGTVEGYDAVVSQTLGPALALSARRSGASLIYDAYDPVTLELLEWHRDATAGARRRIVAHARHWEAFSLDVADFIICASESQRDLWLGALLTRGRITPDLYAADVSLRRFIDVVPFGIPDAPARRTGEGFRTRFGIAASDFVTLWGGGLWNWLDPVSAVEAMHVVHARRPDVKLVFMGMRHPDAQIPQMTVAGETMDRANALGLSGTAVFFNTDWVPYDERVNHLLDAQAGLSLHGDHLESRFAFRTRMLDYMWAGLPIICSAGDDLADLVRQERLGTVVQPGDVRGIASAILAMVAQGTRLAAVRRRFADVRGRFTWDHAVQPLLQMLEDGPAQPIMPRRAGWRALRYYALVSSEFIRHQGLVDGSREMLRLARAKEPLLGVGQSRSARGETTPTRTTNRRNAHR